MSPDSRRPNPLGLLLAIIFCVALLMGPGPGALLVGGDPDKVRTLFGVPALYLWLVFWFLVMAGCIVTAAKLVWKDTD